VSQQRLLPLQTRINSLDGELSFLQMKLSSVDAENASLKELVAQRDRLIADL
jgi:peptidoglycan hydrolase CwlO-like protein